MWQTAENCFYCGVLAGRNTVTSNEELWALFEKGVSIDEMKAVLSTYDDDTYVSVIPIVQPLSSYGYEINDGYRNMIAKKFGINDLHTTVEELTK